jgi:RNA polymerase sigma factor for flagellar operon FliA
MAAPRDQLVEQHLHLVHAIAAKLKRRLGKTMEPGDLVGYGTQGLIEAAGKFDAKQGTAFSTFAYYRIRGAIFDGMRTMGWYSRGDYARFRAEERANDYMAVASEREAADKAAHLAGAVQGQSAGQSDDKPEDKTKVLGDIAEILSGVATVHITSIEAARDAPDDRFQAPDEAVLEAEGRGRVRAALAKLPEKERRLMELYYFADMKLEDAGKKLGLSKSWASRLHSRAVNHLREALEEEES